MITIELQQVLPAVFAPNPPQGSDIWLTETLFEKGKSYLIEADSGTGKSSFCSYLYGYRDDYAGRILFDGADSIGLGIASWSYIRQRSIAMMFQDLRLFPELSALENIELKNRITGHKSSEQIASLFEALGIAAKTGWPVRKLSFGQQQRVAFIRALCQPADFIILDEPVSHLDEKNSAILSHILTEEAAGSGAGIITTSIGRRLEMNYDKILRL